MTLTNLKPGYIWIVFYIFSSRYQDQPIFSRNFFTLQYILLNQILLIFFKILILASLGDFFILFLFSLFFEFSLFLSRHLPTESKRSFFSVLSATSSDFSTEMTCSFEYSFVFCLCLLLFLIFV